MKPHTGQIRKGRKFQQVLEGARTVFMADGYESANVDKIAKTAGVSKATLYSYFPDKRMLFTEVVRLECLQQAERATTDLAQTAPARIFLTEAARHMVEFFLSDFGLSIYRICVAESARFPELGRDFYNSGPQLVADILSMYLTNACQRGELLIDDIDLAARQFGELCKASLFDKRIFCAKADFTQAEIDRVTDGAVKMFLARYGA